MSGLVTDERVLHQREREDRYQRRHREPGAPLAGPAQDEADASDRNHEPGRPVPRHSSLLELHGVLVSRNELEGRPHVVVEVPDPLARREPQHDEGGGGRRGEATQVAQPVARQAENGDRHRDQHGDPGVELDHRLDRREGAAPVNERPRRPGRGVALEREQAPQERERQRDRTDGPRDDRRDDESDCRGRRPRKAAPRGPQEACGKERTQPEEVDRTQRRQEPVDHHRLFEEAKRTEREGDLGAVVEAGVGREVDAEHPGRVEAIGGHDLHVVPREDRDDDPKQARQPGTVESRQQRPQV